MGEFSVTAVAAQEPCILTEVAAEGDIGGRHWQMSHTLGLGGAALVLDVEGKDREVVDLAEFIEAWVRNVEAPTAGGTAGASEMTEDSVWHGTCPWCGREI